MTYHPVSIRTGVSEQAQASDHANGTLQGAGDVAYTIATYTEVLGKTQAQVATDLKRRLTLLTEAARRAGFIVTFEVAIGPADN